MRSRPLVICVAVAAASVSLPIPTAAAFSSTNFYPAAPCGFDAQAGSNPSVAYTHFEYGCQRRVSWRVPGTATPYFYSTGNNDAQTSGTPPAGRVGGFHSVRLSASAWYGTTT